MVKRSVFGLLFDLLEGLFSNISLDLPGGERVSLREHIFDLLKRPPGGLGETEQHMDEREKVKGSKDEISLPRDVGETRGYGPSQGEVEHPGSTLSHNAGSRKTT